MKKIPLLLFMLITFSVYSKNKIDSTYTPYKNHLHAYYGQFNFQQFITIYVELFRGVFNYGTQDSVMFNLRWSGSHGLSYTRSLGKKCELGIDYNYCLIKSYYTNPDDFYDYTDTKYHFNNVGAIVRVNYLNRKIFNLYGGATLGLGIWTIKEIKAATLASNRETGVRANWHINPIGLCIGKRVSGYLELGLGHKGLINAGLRVGF